MTPFRIQCTNTCSTTWTPTSPRSTSDTRRSARTASRRSRRISRGRIRWHARRRSGDGFDRRSSSGPRRSRDEHEPRRRRSVPTRIRRGRRPRRLCRGGSCGCGGFKGSYGSLLYLRVSSSPSQVCVRVEPCLSMDCRSSVSIHPNAIDCGFLSLSWDVSRLLRAASIVPMPWDPTTSRVENARQRGRQMEFRNPWAWTVSYILCNELEVKRRGSSSGMLKLSC